LRRTRRSALSNAELYHRVALEREQSVAILANIAEGVVAVDRDGDVVLWNAAAEEITGVPPPRRSVARRSGAATRARVGERRRESPRLDPARRPRGVAVAVGGGDARPDRCGRRPHLRVPGYLGGARGGADEVRLRVDGVGRAAHALTSIYGFAQTLLRGDIEFTDEERRTFLDFIARESERLTEIVDALLDVAALDTGDLASRWPRPT
jgi:Signal transduction histidine kinase regulating citrate/malate metabolism